MLDLWLELNPPAAVCASLERGLAKPAGSGRDENLRRARPRGPAFAVAAPPPRRPECAAAAPGQSVDHSDRANEHRPAEHSGWGDAAPSSTPVLPGRSKAWIATYLDGGRELIVTRGDPVEDCATLLSDADIGGIWSFQRVIGGMLRIAPAVPCATATTDERWILKGGGFSPAKPALGGAAPAEGFSGRLRVCRPRPMPALGAWEVHWPGGEVWAYVCSTGLDGPELAAALARQVSVDCDFAVKRIDFGRLPLADIPVPSRWTSFVERPG